MFHDSRGGGKTSAMEVWGASASPESSAGAWLMFAAACGLIATLLAWRKLPEPGTAEPVFQSSLSAESVCA